MNRHFVAISAWLLVAAANVSAADGSSEYPFAFRDVTTDSGLLPGVAGIRGHGAGWGDADGDGWLDLYVGTFHDQGSQPNLFFRNAQGIFRRDEQAALRISTRANTPLFVDLDNDGDLDLYVASMPGNREGRELAGCSLFRNEGGGRFTNVSAENSACPANFMGRSVAALDFDGDGLLDLLVGEDPTYAKAPGSRLFRNLGRLQFEDATAPAGLPRDIPGLGVAAGDVNNDGWPDVFLAARGGGNRLFLNTGRGIFREAASSARVFHWEFPKGDDSSAGVCLGDVNRDGWLDIVVGQHFKTPWQSPVAVRLYLNRGSTNGEPAFEDVTEAAGLVPLAMKAPHVEQQDFDNDGWPDLLVSIVKFKDGRPYPILFKHRGLPGTRPRFTLEGWSVNDFPTDADRNARGSTGPFFEKLLRERKITYMAAAPSGDFDRDGRLDLFLASWWTEAPSLLLRNETPGGHWLGVRVEGRQKVNRMGLGARITVYAAGQLGNPAARLGCQEIAVGYGYVSGQSAGAHFGLGSAAECDVEVILPHGQGRRARQHVKADQILLIEN